MQVGSQVLSFSCYNCLLVTAAASCKIEKGLEQREKLMLTAPLSGGRDRGQPEDFLFYLLLVFLQNKEEADAIEHCHWQWKARQRNPHLGESP